MVGGPEGTCMIVEDVKSGTTFVDRRYKQISK